jgi:outer membrane PBP1 activator LpoA protein
MNLPRLASLLVLTTGILVLWLSGCSTGVRPGAPPLDARVLEQVQLLETTGDFQRAAAMLMQAAAQTDLPGKLDYQLLAVDSLIRGGDYEQATGILDSLPPGQLSERQQQHYTVSRAQLAVIGKHPEKALELLHAAPADGPYAAEYRRLRAAAYQQSGDYFSSAQEYIARDTLLTDPEAQLENRFLTWEALNGLSDTELQQRRTAPPPDVLSGWMELVELTRLYLQQPDALAEVIPHWQMRYPGHPASDTFIAKLLYSMQIAGQPPAQVALLLPLSGTLSGAATAIRDGLLAAYYDTSEGTTRPVIRVYDVGSDPATVVDVYQQAVADGARFIIGPLRKEAVQILSQQEALPVPVLALNQASTGDVFNTAIFQFGLAPEDEAREVARHAWHEGHTRAITLVPQGDWGNRVYTAFAEEWTTLGGILLEQQTYDPEQVDHGTAISTALNLDGSKARHLRLVRLLGQPLEYEPRRRQDTDFIFLLATPQQARLLRPQLLFYRASRLPVYSTSHVYTGHPDQALDSDTNGIVFCDMPWTIENAASWQHLHQYIYDQWPANAARYGRFYALGIDAWRITPYLGQLGGVLLGTYHGVTGNLSLDSRQQVHRTLRWAEFRNGLPVLLETRTVPVTAPPPAPVNAPP